MKKVILATIFTFSAMGLIAKGLAKHQYHRSGRHLFTRFSEGEPDRLKKLDGQKIKRISFPVLEVDYTYSIASSSKKTAKKNTETKMAAEGMVTHSITEDVFLGAGGGLKMSLKNYADLGLPVPLPTLPNLTAEILVGKKIAKASMIRLGVSFDPKDKQRNSIGYLNYEIRY